MGKINYVGKWIALGAGIRTALRVALLNIANGLAIGIALDAAMGVGLDG